MNRFIRPFLVLTCILGLVGLTAANAFAVDSSTWALSSTTTTTYVVAGNVTSANQSTGNLAYSDYTGTGGSQRLSISSASKTLPAGGIDVNTFAQYVISPAAGYNLTVNSLTLSLGGGGTSNVRAAISYSLNADFSSPTVIVDPSSPVVLGNNAMSALSYTPSVTVNDGQTLYVRVYPWLTSSGTSKYLLSQNVVLSGTASVSGTPPTVTTVDPITAIAQTTATGGGNVTAEGTASVTARGVCWSTSPNPTTANSLTSDGTGAGAFVSSLTGLTPGTLYHVRAYATSVIGTSYGSDVVFSTIAPPVLNSPTSSAVTTSSATLGGTIATNNGATITENGVAYNTTLDPTAPTVAAVSPSQSGAFTVDVTGLTSNTDYHYRAYAINSEGTSYTADATFTSLPDAPVAAAASAVGSVSFVANWAAVSGTSAVSYRLDVSTDNAFGTFVGVYNDFTVAGTSQVVTGLTSEVTYYYRVRAVNAGGAGANSSTITAATVAASAPLVITPTAASIGSATAVLGADVSSDGNSALSERGVVWSLVADPTILDNKVVEGGTTTGVYTVSVSGLSAATVVHYRGYATNAVGTSYTPDASFTTLSAEPSAYAGSFAATGVAYNEIDLSWTVAPGATGYIVLRRQGADPTGLPLDATAYAVGNTIGDGTVVAVLMSGAATSAPISGLAAMTQYNFSIIPFAWDGVNAVTYNYKTDGTVPTANAMTLAPAMYRSVASGNWNDVATWQVSADNGVTWVAASATPTAIDGAVTIQGGNTVTLSADTTVDQLTINATGVLLVATAKKLTIANGADSIDVDVSGTLNQYGQITANGRIAFESGARYIYSVPAATGSPMAPSTWRTGSTLEIDSTSGTNPSNLNTQALANLTINAPLMGANGGPNFNDGTVINGDLTVTNTHGVQWRIANFSAGNIKTIEIKGNVNVNGPSAILTGSGSGADTLAHETIIIDGDINISAGTLGIHNSSSIYSEWRLKGNLNITGGKLASGSTGFYGRRMLTFAGGGTQNFNATRPDTQITNAPTVYKVANNSTVMVNYPWTLLTTSVLSLESGQFVTAAPNIITVPASGQILGGSASSYVNGPLTMVIASTTTTAKTFPVGKGSAYRPVTVTVTHDAATATPYTAEVFNTTPPARTLPGTLLSVSPVRYTTITKNGGSTISSTLGATVQMSYGPDDGVTDATLLRVAKDSADAIAWRNLGGSGTANGTGSITSNTFYSFSNFVLAIADTTTPAIPPTVTTAAISNITPVSASSGGNVSNDGGAAVSTRGVCWNTTGSATIADTKTTDGTGTGIFTSSLAGLTPGVTYYVRAYATNTAGTGYGNEQIFTTLVTILTPTVTTTTVSNILVTSAVSGGNVTDWGGSAVTARGVCWSTSTGPTIANSHSLDGSDLGSYISGLAPLVGGTTYYVRAYATNIAGTGYGNEVSFSTLIAQNDTTVVVAQDGSGNYTTVQAAFNAVPTNYTGKWTIFVKKGSYYEKDVLAVGKINVVLQGESRDSTIITFDDYADSHGTGNPGTSGSYTIAIDASDFVAKDITFQNTYYPNKYGTVSGTQAVALRTQGDRHEYINVTMLGYQDTYYTWGGNGTGRMYHKNCFIEGTVDFIFGRDICVFDNCTIHEIRGNGACLTAGSTDGTSQYGYTFRNCTIIADSIGYDGLPNTSFFLGRPWQANPRTVFINTNEPWNLNPAGWQAWGAAPNLYAEFNCFGAGSATGGRVPWSSQLDGPTASTYSLTSMFAKNAANSSLILYDWMPASALTDQPLPMRIAASAGANGSISDPGTSNVAWAGVKAYTISPAPGYHVESVAVDGNNVGPVTTYTFSNISANHTIAAAFTQTAATALFSNGTGGGDWASAATWAGGVKPSATDSVVIIGTDSVTVSVSDTCKGLQLTPTAKVALGARLGLINGSITGKVYGNTNGFLFGSGALVFGSGGTYIHAMANGTIPMATWGTGSTCLVTGFVSGNKPANSNQNFYNFTWNCPTQGTTNIDIAWFGNTIGGNLTVVNTGAGRLYFTSPGAGSPNTITINGDINVSGGALSSNGSSSAAVITIEDHGNINVTGGNFACTRGSAPTVTWNFYGDMAMANATTQNTSATSKFVFKKAGTQLLSLSTMTFAGGGLPVEVATGTTLNAGASVLQGTGIFTLNPGATLITANATGLAGLLQNTGAITLSPAASYVFNGSVAQTTGAALTAASKLTISNATGVTLSASATVNDTLALGDNTVATGANTLAIGAAGAVTRGSGRVIGNLQKSIGIGATAATFEVGDTANYSPVSVAFSNVDTAGTLTASATRGLHPQIGTSGLSATRVLNRYYTLTNGGVSFDSIAATFNFVAGDVLGGANTANFVVQKFDAVPGWTAATAVNLLATSIEVTGVTTLSDFAIGEIPGVVTADTTKLTLNNGWNIVSLPRAVANDTTGVLFPGALSGTIYSFKTGSYAKPVTLTPGEGYWAFYLAGQENRIVGEAITSDSITIATGNRWVLIGSVTNATSVANLTSNPPGAILAGTLYGYAPAGYSHPTTLDPMKGYWVFISAPCTMKISQ